jgi:protein SCO1
MTRPLRCASGLLLALVLAAGCSSGSSSSDVPTTSRLNQPSASGVAALAGAEALDFTLRDQDGRPVGLRAQRGRVVLLTFLYTHCRDVCPLIAVNLNDVLRGLGAQRQQVRVIAVSVDPARDTRSAIRAFVKLHRLLPEFRYVTGPVPALRQVWQNYNVLAMPRNQEVVDHSSPTLLIDRAGRPRTVYPSNLETGPVLHDVRKLLAAR